MKPIIRFILSKTALLVLCLLIQFKGIGQKDTTIIKTNDSLVVTTKETAVFIVKDLLKLDIVQKENEYLKQDTSLLQKQINTYKKDSLTNKQIAQGYMGSINNYRVSLQNCEEYARKKTRNLLKLNLGQRLHRHFCLSYQFL